ncbi:nitronate monooxygenase [Pseudoteredinibacter isoporae]|uniref:Nitronate monooxygenase n=2 Tax=Pseudoteredinibacter isoporae TaxID=570281 RepID=A0A7X0JUU4_9GAMM|nr:nitronate monooxygenase [Pseudoteredinibacter isoporae]NHO87648.1 nitronate monooxygenase [Pseudoteredinibacter isoporae]NIB24021.1 nitronate monooxygenase [Pseudoteredinibacter isoporae]
MSITEVLGIDIPLLQSPMAGAQDWRLAVAVARAGGLGAIPCGMLGPEQIEEQIRAFREHSNANYNLNFFCHNMPELNEESLQKWQNRLTTHYQALNVAPPETLGTLRRPFDQTIANILAPYQPPVISFHFGLPSAALLQQVKSWGTVVLSSATTLEEALYLEKHGADAIIAQGLEAGGHRGMFLNEDLSKQITTTELLSQCKNRVSKPIIAAGGIASASDILQVMDLGAEAVQLGTNYLLCDESNSSQVHREAILDSKRTTALTNVFSGRPARGISNKLMQALNNLSDDAPEFPYATPAVAPLRTKAEANQSGDYSPLWSGSNRSGCRAVSATTLSRELWNEVLALKQDHHNR